MKNITFKLQCKLKFKKKDYERHANNGTNFVEQLLINITRNKDEIKETIHFKSTVKDFLDMLQNIQQENTMDSKREKSSLEMCRDRLSRSSKANVLKINNNQSSKNLT